MKISKPCLIDTFKDEYHLNENESLDEARDMMKYKPVKQNRPSIMSSFYTLTDEEEQNERIAEQIANKYGLKYFQQSCIAARNDAELPALNKARKEIAKYMDVDEIEHPTAPNKDYEWIFVFWS